MTERLEERRVNSSGFEAELVGVKCPICQEEAFQLFEREARLSSSIVIQVRVCKRCDARIDMDNAAAAEAAGLAGMSKVERLQFKKDKSHEWAWGWHGKHVIASHIEVDYGNGLRDPITCVKKVRGTAFYDSKHTDRGYGRLKVVLDDEELKRIVYLDIEHPGWKRKPTIDGEEFGISSHLITHGGYYSDPNFGLHEPVAIRVNWGERDEIVLEEITEETERLEAAWIEAEREKEAALHRGEGI